jgi:hypothetical protein
LLFVFHLLVHGTWNLLIHCFPLSFITSSQAGLFLEAASGADINRRLFFYGIFLCWCQLS